MHDTYWFAVTDDPDHMTEVTCEMLAQRCHVSTIFQQQFDRMVRDMTSFTRATPDQFIAARQWCFRPATEPPESLLALYAVPVLREIARSAVTPTVMRTGTRDDMDAALGRVVWLCPSTFSKHVPRIANVEHDVVAPLDHPCPCARVSDVTVEWVRSHPLVTGRRETVRQRIKERGQPEPVDVPEMDIDLTW